MNGRLGDELVRLHRRGLKRSRRRSLSTVGRCNDALILIKIVVTSSCKDEDVPLGDEKAFDVEIPGLKRHLMLLTISAVSSSEYLRAELSKGDQHDGTHWSHSPFNIGSSLNRAFRGRRISISSYGDLLFHSSTT